MMNKRAIQLSVNFIVMLIIALVVFGFGIKLAFDLMSEAETIREEVDENTQREIEEALMGGSQVSIPINRKETKIGKSINFGLGIFNIEDTQYFTINMNFENAYDSATKEPINVNGNEWILTTFGPYEINKNDQKILPLPMSVPRNIDSGQTPAGTYIFKVIVKGEDGTRYGSIQKVYVEVI